jgi:hypothetical protein
MKAFLEKLWSLNEIVHTSGEQDSGGFDEATSAGRGWVLHPEEGCGRASAENLESTVLKINILYPKNRQSYKRVGPGGFFEE